MVNKKQTSRKVAHDASKLLRDPKTPKKVKEIAASAVSQARGKNKSKGKKR
jgi:hypothetical protein